MHLAVQTEMQVEGHASGWGPGGRLAILLRGPGRGPGRRWRRGRCRRDRDRGHIELRVAADAGGDHAGGPATQEAVQERRGGQALQAEVTGGMREHAALISVCCGRPFECCARAGGATRHENADGAGLGQAAEATAVAGVAHGGLAWCFRLDPYDARGHGWTLRASGRRVRPGGCVGWRASPAVRGQPIATRRWPVVTDLGANEERLCVAPFRKY